MLSDVPTSVSPFPKVEKLTDLGKGKGTVTWMPVKGIGNAQVGGKKSTAITLSIEGQIVVPLPGLMKMVVAPVVEGEFEKLVEKYLDNLIARFGGEA